MGRPKIHDKASRASYDRDARRRVHNAVLALLGDICTHCGHTDKRVLQVDHINRATEPRNHSHRSGIGLWYAILRGDKPLSNFQLLCANCNFLKKLENKEFYPVHKTGISSHKDI